MRLVAYINGIHAVDPIIDGFVLGVWEGRAPRYEEGSMPFGTMTRSSVTTSRHRSSSSTASSRRPRWPTSARSTPTRSGSGRRRARLTVRRRSDRRRRLDVESTGAHTAARRCTARDATLVDRGDRSASPAAYRRRAGSASTCPARRARERVGGIRLPELAAPLREYRGIAFGTGRPPLMGSSRARCARRRQPSLSVTSRVRSPSGAQPSTSS